MTGGLRGRAILDRNWGVALAVCVLAALAGGWVAYDAHASESTVEETRTVEEGQVAVDWEHSARVTNVDNSTAFSPDERVENRSVYLARVMPVLDLAVTFDYGTDTDAPVRLSVDRRLVVRNVDSRSTDRGEPTVYWQRTEPLGSSTRTLQPAETDRGTFEVNVTETFRAARNESERLGAPGQDEVRVVVDVTASRGDGPNRTRTFVLPIVGEAQTYAVQDEDGAIRFNGTRTVSVEATPGPLRAYGGPTLAVTGLVGGALLVAGRRLEAFAVSDADRERLAYRNHREEYADWITAGRLPSQAFDHPRVDVESLAGLVDVAIDTDERVIHDVGRESFHVVGDDLRYVYEPPAAVRGDAAGGDVLVDEGTEVAAATDEPREPSEGGDDGASFDEAVVEDAFDDSAGEERDEDVVDEGDEAAVDDGDEDVFDEGDEDVFDDAVEEDEDAVEEDENAVEEAVGGESGEDAVDSDGESPASSGRPERGAGE
jgi:hypothetical protein